MGKIVILDENTANQIAAGEVIERPASIVKEMVENSLDANATAITVDIVNGGIKSIRITDNGDGMENDDIELAFERHATSKIRKIEDLNQLSTMGFRGEALASIASVAKVEVVTKTEQAPNGVRVNIEAGNVLLVEPAGTPKGTTFTVRELFYNTPARYKFLKKDTTEAGYIQDILTRIALARPDVSFKLISQGRPLMHTPGNHDLLSTIYSIYGKEIAHAVVPVNASGEGVEVSGFVGKPEIARGNRSFQSILVNGRFVYNRVITAALEEAYKTRLMQKRFPFAVLKLNLSPWFVDVNVHPSKLEVRFSDDQKVFRAVYHAVSEALNENVSFRPMENTPSIRYGSNTGMNLQPSQQKASAAAHQVATPFLAGNMQTDGRTKEKEPVQPVREGFPTKVETNIGTGAPTRDGTTTGAGVPSSARGVYSGSLFHPLVTGQQTQVFQNDGNDEIKTQTAPDIKSKPAEPGQFHQTDTPAEPGQFQQTDKYADPANLQQTAKPVEAGSLLSMDHHQETPPSASGKERLLRARVIGQAFESYIFMEEGEEILLIDQHAAHERIRYEKLKKQFILQESFGQGLLSPLAVNLSELEMVRFHELSQYLSKLGFEAEVFGNRSILIRAIPYALDSSFSGQDFLEIFEKLSSEALSVSEIIPEETIYMMACKSAIKANRNMSVIEIRGLVEQLANTENPYTCVHGRPVIISMTKKELEKRFKRIV
ncbi:MAG: DNA mismatch repair endonuclease MutL [Ruminiclostridium sp.]|nr:DNA mismatch repair endonuclease MutL [Ruminiclostridium sp.]